MRSLVLIIWILSATAHVIHAQAYQGSLIEAQTLIRQGQFEEAERQLEIIQAGVAFQSDVSTKALTKSTVGLLQLHRGRTDRAEETLREALRIFDAAGKGSSEEAAQTLSHLGILYMSLGKYSLAQEHLHRALSIRQSSHLSVNESLAATYNDLGLVYSQTDNSKALVYYAEAEKMYRSLYGEQHPKIAIAKINTGIVHRNLGLYDDAAQNFRHALDILANVYPGAHAAKGMALYNLGQTALHLKNQQATREYYDHALKMYQQCYGSRHPEIASVLNAIGNLQVSEGAFDQALDTYQQALHANMPDFNNTDVQSNSSLQNYYNGTRLLHTLMFKAQALESRYLRRSVKFSDLSEALQIVIKCDSLIDILRHQSPNENDKLVLGAMASEVYSDGSRIAYEAALNAVKKYPYFEKAFYFAEKSKGAVLLESISDTNAKSFAGIPGSLLEEEKDIRAELARNAQRLAEKPPAEEERQLRANQFDLSRRYERFIERLEHDYPQYYNLKFNTAIPSVHQVQQLVDEKTALISYTIDEKNDHLYIFLIRKHHFRVWRRSLTNDFNRYITGLSNSLYFVEINTFKETAYSLARTLLPPLPPSIDNLIILPAGRLATLPFETLLLSNPDKIFDYASLPYLMTQFNVRYEFSAGLLLQDSDKIKHSGDARSILLCAPVTFPERKYLGELPGTKKEVSDISRLFVNKNLMATSYVGSDACENRLKDGILRNYAYLHFATHGLVDEKHPEMSRIFLQAGAPEEDGNLFAGEIYNLELTADLVTLSACETGLGKIYKGEGVIGLSRALTYAGARSIIVSFWNVADESTALLMTDFYQHVLENPNEDYSENLRKAKMGLLQHKAYAAPYYWAPFVLIGF